MAGLDRITGTQIPPDMNGVPSVPGSLPPGPAVQSSLSVRIHQGAEKVAPNRIPASAEMTFCGDSGHLDKVHFGD